MNTTRCQCCLRFESRRGGRLTAKSCQGVAFETEIWDELGCLGCGCVMGLPFPLGFLQG
jgi:hypothetical protein